jgi:methionyl-tRNA synthetase
LSAYGDRLRAHIEANPDFLLPDTRRNEVLAFIDQGLRDIAISRRSTGWGIPVPGDESKVIYVWFDALINYLTETGWPDNPDYHHLWPCDAHLMAKEIYTRFHATLWPAMLMGLGLPLPRHVVGHGWWTVSGEKGSKSKGNIPSAESVVALLEERSGAPQNICVDALRYYLLRDISFTGDAEFSTDSLLRRYNADLANDLGNVLNRVLRAKYFDGRVPEPRDKQDEGKIDLRSAARFAIDVYEKEMEHVNWGAALSNVFHLIWAVNAYLAEKQPWILAKNGQSEDVADVVYEALEATRLAAYLVSPVMPHVSREMGRQLGLSNFATDGSWSEQTRWGVLVPGSPTGDAQPLFPRIDTKAATAQSQPAAAKPKDKPAVTDTANTAAPTTPTDTITIDDFARVQLRVADILSAERVEGRQKTAAASDPRWRERRAQLVAGIAETYAPEELPGKKIVVVANLQPATIRGVQSQGMLLAATDEQGRAILLTPEKPVVAGATVR